MSKELIIIRHARSLYNVGETQKLDEGLTEFGWKQSAILAKFFAGDNVKFIDHVFETHKATMYVSPFIRTLQTAVRLKEKFPKINATIDHRLGEYVNHIKNDLIFVPLRRDLFPEFNWNLYEDGFTYNHPDQDDAWYLDRIHEFYDSLPEDRPSIVITHGLPALTLLRVSTQENVNYVPVWDFSIGNASITWIKNNRAIWLGRDLYHETENILEFSEKSHKYS